MDSKKFLHSFLKASELPNASQKGPLSLNPTSAAAVLAAPGHGRDGKKLPNPYESMLTGEGVDSAGGPPIVVKPPVPGPALMGGGIPPAAATDLANNFAAGGGGIVYGRPTGTIPPGLTAGTASPQTADPRTMPPGSSPMPAGRQGPADTQGALPVMPPGKQYLEMYLGRVR